MGVFVPAKPIFLPAASSFSGSGKSPENCRCSLSAAAMRASDRDIVREKETIEMIRGISNEVGRQNGIIFFRIKVTQAAMLPPEYSMADARIVLIN
jgi:hypothetical protein